MIEAAPASADGTRTLRLLSVVAPMLDEQEVVRAFYERVCSALEGIPFELIVVDDGSSDATPDELAAIADGDSRVRVIHLSRPFGHQSALTAGLELADGDCVVMLDGDLQDPPELIPKLVRRWEDGDEVVYACRVRRDDGGPALKRVGTRWFHGLFNKLSEVPAHEDAGHFRLLGRPAVDALLSMPEHHRFLPGMTAWVGFRQGSVPYVRQPRHGGEPRMSARQLIAHAFDAMLSFSLVPLHAAAAVGAVVLGLGLLAIPVLAAILLAGGSVPLLVTVIEIVLLVAGLQLVVLGVLGEYLGRVYDETRSRPLYVVSRVRNLTGRKRRGVAA
jgi:glycosyltransferase involved in cell wall biosynthesis